MRSKSAADTKTRKSLVELDMGKDKLEFKAYRQSGSTVNFHQPKNHDKLCLSPLHTVSQIRGEPITHVRYSKWEKNGSLSFIPPDGRFRLLEYETEAKVQLPLAVEAAITLEENGGEDEKWSQLKSARFSVTVTSRTNHRSLEDIIISICLGKGATSVSATANGDRRPLGAPTGPGGAGRKEESSDGWVGGGSWEFDPNSQVRGAYARLQLIR